MVQPAKYRIPPTSLLKLGAQQALPLQVNFCKNLQCDNFGITAKEEPIKPGPNPNRDFHYKVTSTAKGRVPALLCKSCKEKIPIKSNVGIAAEFERITHSLPQKKLPVRRLHVRTSGVLLGYTLSVTARQGCTQ